MSGNSLIKTIAEVRNKAQTNNTPHHNTTTLQQTNTDNKNTLSSITSLVKTTFASVSFIINSKDLLSLKKSEI